MFTLPLLVLAGALSYMYRSYTPDGVANAVLRKFYGRLRKALALTIVAILILSAYQLPTEIGQYFKRIQYAQNALAADRQARKDASEIQRARQMIDAFEGVDNYLAYLKWQDSPNPEKNYTIRR